MSFDILAVLISGISLTILLNSVLKYGILSRFSRTDKYRYYKIEHVLKRINAPRLTKIDDKELIQMLLEYSMNANNYNAGITTISKMEKISSSSAVHAVADRARSILKERCFHTPADKVGELIP